MDDELDYLQPDFDPNSLTIPKLRAIFVEHDIQYPSTAKKGQLVDVFEEQLRPRARKILSARKRIQRTSRGITDMPSSTEGSTVDGADDDDDTTPPPQPKTPARRTRKSVVPTTEDSALLGTARASKTPSRKTSSKRLTASATVEPRESEPPTTVRRSRSRRSEATPAVKIEEAEEQPRRRGDRESVFTSDNPFQSGSSPAVDSEPRRRTTSGGKRKSSSGRKSTENAPTQDEGTKTTYEVPVSRIRQSRIKTEPEDTLEPSEEFTVEEEQDLIQSGAARGEVDVLPPRRKTKKQRSRFPSPIWIVLGTILTGYAAWYRNEKVELGYCGVGKQVTTLEEIDGPEWASFLQPQCEPCPLHAYCFADMEVKCESDFMLQSHPLSLGGLVPIPPTCEPDSEKVRKVQAVANRAVEELRERRAKFECGTATEADGSPVSSAAIDEPVLKAKVSAKRRRGMSEADFESLWKDAIPEIVAREEVSSDSDGYVNDSHNHPLDQSDSTETSRQNSRHLQISSSSLAKLPLGCALRRSARQTLARYRIPIGGILVIIAAVAYARMRLFQIASDKARVPALVASTLDRLATQAALHAQGHAQEAFISATQMRDDVLRDEFSFSRRNGIWKRVKDVVEMNTNVRSNTKTLRNGDISPVWEWVGTLPSIEDGGDRRKSGRYSLGPLAGTPGKASPEPRSSPLKNDGVEYRRWDEGRPIY